MKKILAIVTLLTAALAVSAQQKGDMYVSGALAVSGGDTKTTTTIGDAKTSTTTPSTTHFSIMPQFGYFIMDNLEVNVAVGYGLTKTRYNATLTDDRLFGFEHQFRVNPGVRYYVALGSDKFFYTPGANLSFGFDKTYRQLTSTTQSTPETPFVFGFAINLASFEIKPTEHFGIMLSAGSLTYSLSHKTTKDIAAGRESKVSTTENSASLGLNLDASIGFKYYF